MDAAEALEHFKNDMAKVKKNLSNIVAISAIGAIGAFCQFNCDEINTFLKLDHNSRGTEAIFNPDELKEDVFIHLYKLASETRTLIYNYEILLGKFEPENYLQVIQSLSDKLDYCC
jgi:hypothetical protein